MVKLKSLKGKALQHYIEDITGVPRGTYYEGRPFEAPEDTPFIRLLKRDVDFAKKARGE